MIAKSSLKIGIIGAGKVGSALAQSLRMSGYQVNGIASLTHASAAKLAILVGANVQSLDEITQQIYSGEFKTSEERTMLIKKATKEGVRYFIRNIERPFKEYSIRTRRQNNRCIFG